MNSEFEAIIEDTSKQHVLEAVEPHGVDLLTGTLEQNDREGPDDRGQQGIRGAR